jgi:hypothetical protein
MILRSLTAAMSSAGSDARMTGSPGDDEPQGDSGMAAGREMQRSGSSRRLTSAVADEVQADQDPDQSSADNLMSGNVPEEDGVEHRAEPQALADGDAEAPVPAADAQGSDADRPAPADEEFAASTAGMPPSMPLNGAADAAAGAPVPVPSASPGNRGFVPAAQAAGAATGAMRMSPPYPSAATARPGPMSRITAPFSGLTRTAKPAKPGKAKAKTQKPAGQKRPPAAGPVRQGALPAAAPQRKAQLVLSRLEPWSVMKFSFMISLVGWVVLFVAVAAVYFVLARLGVFTQIEHTIGLVTATKTSPGPDAASWFSASRVLGYTMLAGAVNVVLITALATVGAVVYNLVTHLAGGIEVTLKETD